MKAKQIYICIAITVLITLVNIFTWHQRQNDAKPEASLGFATTTLFMDEISACPDSVERSVSERTECLSDQLDAKIAEADALANKLITIAPIRREEIISKNIGPMRWEYGGEDFLAALPELVQKAQKAKEEYSNDVCNLAMVNIFGSTGMTIEKLACWYFYEEQYLGVLKNLEGGLTATRE